MHGEEANLILGEPALANAPRGDGRRHREAHDDEEARRQRDHRQRDIGERGGGRLVDGEGVDARDLAVFASPARRRGRTMSVAGQAAIFDASSLTDAWRALRRLRLARAGASSAAASRSPATASGLRSGPSTAKPSSLLTNSFWLADAAQGPAWSDGRDPRPARNRPWRCELAGRLAGLPASPLANASGSAPRGSGREPAARAARARAGSCRFRQPSSARLRARRAPERS